MAKIFVSFNLVSTADFLLVARESDDPIAEVYRSAVLTPPHTVRNITITDVNPVMHRVELWTTSDGTTLDELRGVCDIDASINNEVAFGYIQFIVGRGNGAPEYDPEPETAEYVNPDLDGKDYLVFKAGQGPLTWGTDIQTISGGGFEFINGTLFGGEEQYTVQYSNITSSTTTSSGRSYPSDIIEITADTAFGSTHYGKLIEVNSASAAVLTITIASLDTLPNGTIFGINTHNGNQKSVTLQLNTGRYCWINTTSNGPQQRNAVYIGRGESVTFIKKGSALRVVQWDGDYRRVGQRIFCDGLAPVNTLPETGGWYLFADYPRFVNWYLADLPGSELGTGTQDVVPDAANKTKFIMGTTKFWMADTKGLFVRATSSDGTVDLGGPRLAMSYEADENKAHNHVTAPWNKASAMASDVDGTATPSGLDSGLPTQEYMVGHMTAPRWTAATIVSQGTESRPKNVATNFYRII
jgi:hypothetical protein